MGSCPALGAGGVRSRQSTCCGAPIERRRGCLHDALARRAYASRAMLLYASIRSPANLTVNAALDKAANVTLSWNFPMWQKLSLRARINLLLALVLTLGLAINIARLVVEAGPRVQAEDQSVIRLAREFIEMIVADLNEAPDPEARLNRITGDLSRLRHVSI